MARAPRRSRNVAIDGAKITAARHHTGLTQHQLAQKAGISQSYLSSLETGDRTRMHPKLYDRLCDALDITDRTTLMTEPTPPKEPQ